MLERLCVVLVRPKYPENIGAAARACMNMGCPNLVLAAPREFELERALPMATAQARDILLSARVVSGLPEALADVHVVVGATARTGGWRRGILAPAETAALVLDRMAEDCRAALVFGPEDAGLTNEETLLCHHLVTIPTHQAGTSLNLAQAVLILLYECRRAALERTYPPPPPDRDLPSTHAEQETLLAAVQQALGAIDVLRPDNQDYWMLPVRRFLSRFVLRRNEFNLLMGVCRQINWLARDRKKP